MRSRKGKEKQGTRLVTETDNSERASVSTHFVKRLEIHWFLLALRIALFICLENSDLMEPSTAAFCRGVQADGFSKPAESHPASLIFGNTFGWVYGLRFTFILLYLSMIYIHIYFTLKIPGKLSYSFRNQETNSGGRQEASLMSVIFMSSAGNLNSPQF